MTEETNKKDVVPSHYRELYRSTGGTCGDFIAKELSRVADDGVMALNAVKRENAIEEDRWSNFNPGMQRMNLANTLRARYLKGESVRILGKQYNVQHQLEEFIGEIEDTANSLYLITGFLELNDSDRVRKNLRKVLFPDAVKAEKKAKKAA